MSIFEGLITTDEEGPITDDFKNWLRGCKGDVLESKTVDKVGVGARVVNGGGL